MARTREIVCRANVGSTPSVDRHLLKALNETVGNLENVTNFEFLRGRLVHELKPVLMRTVKHKRTQTRPRALSFVRGQSDLGRRLTWPGPFVIHNSIFSGRIEGLQILRDPVTQLRASCQS